MAQHPSEAEGASPKGDPGFYFPRLQSTGTRGRRSRSPETPDSPPKEHPPPEEETEDKPRRNLAELLGLNRKGADDHVGTDL